MEIFTWTFTILAMLGVYLNVKKNIWCFYLWSVSNLGFCLFNLHLKHYAQAALFAFNLVFVVWGIIEWRKPKEVLVEPNSGRWFSKSTKETCSLPKGFVESLNIREIIKKMA